MINVDYEAVYVKLPINFIRSTYKYTTYTLLR